MRMFRPLLVTMLIALALCACGNKGDLVKPMPSKLPPPTTPDSTAPQPDTAAKPAQDSGGH